MSIPRHLLLKAAAVVAMGALLPFSNPAKADAARLCDEVLCLNSCDEVPPGMCGSCFRPVVCLPTGNYWCPFVAYCDAESR
jgi:hypothetical protein